MLTLGLIGTWQVFDQIYIVTQGGPAKTTLTPAYLSYRRRSTTSEWGAGAAIAFVLFAIIVALTLVQRCVCGSGRARRSASPTVAARPGTRAGRRRDRRAARAPPSRTPVARGRAARPLVVYVVSLVSRVYSTRSSCATSFKTEADAAANPLSLVPQTGTTAAYRGCSRSDFPLWFANSVVVTLAGHRRPGVLRLAGRLRAGAAAVPRPGRRCSPALVAVMAVPERGAADPEVPGHQPARDLQHLRRR